MYFNFYYGHLSPLPPHIKGGVWGTLGSPCFIYAQTTMHFSEMRWIDAVV